MKNNLLQLRETARQEILATKNLAELENVELKYFGRKDGLLNTLLKSLKDLSPEEKKEIGQLANQVKVELEEALATQKTVLEKQEVASTLETDRIDVTLPSIAPVKGSLNPTTLVQNELEDIFKSLGFMVLDGPELESDYYNFEALNIPEHHPARDMQDTFYIKGTAKAEKRVLRTHTSPVQIRAMQKFGAPLRAVVPGRVFRYEALDASHENTFYQLEGIMIDENISITNLIAVMKTLLRGIFKRDVKVRLRPGSWTQTNFNITFKYSTE